MQVTWFIVAGLVGVTLVISKGKLFEGLRNWLLAFEVRANPLRIAGDALSCSMCSGVWVGAVGALLLGGSLPEAIILGGLVSVVSWPMGELLSALERRFERKGAPENRMMAMLEARAQERQRRRAELREKPASSNISEEQAHEWLDEQDRLDEEVLSDPALVEKYRRRKQETEEAA